MKRELVAGFRLLALAQCFQGAAAAHDTGLSTNIAQEGDVMTASASATDRAAACEQAINMARNFCRIRRFFRRAGYQTKNSSDRQTRA
jgi:hypothetical protein